MTHRICLRVLAAVSLCTAFGLPSRVQAQPPSRPVVEAAPLVGPIRLDGVLSEPDWATAVAIDNLTMIEPRQGAVPTGRTSIRVLADRSTIVIGIECDDPAPAGIVSYTKARDGALDNEDHVKLVFDTFQDGRSGYVFAVNPGGARYDGLVEPGGESVNANWDGVWEAATHRDARGWSVEIRIPIATLAFKPGLTSWAFNVQRRVQRLQETDRWASPQRDFKVTLTSRAGLLSALPAFTLGRGLSVRPAAIAGVGMPAPGAPVSSSFEPALDITQRLGANLLASATVNTDFAETEVDTRRTNFTRFPLFFPEKRTFFLEGSDIFAFGRGLGEDLLPFYSRRIGLVDAQAVPLTAGAKLTGRTGNTNLGALVVRTGRTDGVAPASTVGVVRVKQNVLDESSVGAIVTMGDPLGRPGSWLAGGDFTFQTSRFRGGKNLAVGVWGLAMGRNGLGGDASAVGITADYPNDVWDTVAKYRRVGRDFDPPAGFVARPGVQVFEFNTVFQPRPGFWHIRQMFNEWENQLVTGLDGQWQSYEVFTAPVNWRFESGDRVEWNWVPMGERLTAPFEVADGVVIPAGAYHWTRYRIEAGTAVKRRFSTQVTFRYGGFYDGSMNQWQVTGTWNPLPLMTLEFTGEHDVIDLPAGRVVESVAGTRLRFNISSDLTISSYVQYDTVSRGLGTNTRLRWTFAPLGDLFVIYNHNVSDLTNRWRFDSNQLLVKFQYAFRY